MRRDYKKLIFSLIFILSITSQVFAGSKDSFTNKSTSGKTSQGAQSSERNSTALKLMVLIQESHNDINSGNIQLAETEMISLLKKDGFKLVDSEQINAVKKKGVTEMALSGDFKEAKILGLEYGAQYIIVGEAVIKSSSELIQGSNFKSIQAVLQLKILQASTGEILGPTIKQAVVAHINELTGATKALKQAVGDAVETFVTPKIRDSRISCQQNGISVKLNILGVDTFKRYKMITEAFEYIDNITSSRKQGWNKSSGLLSLDVTFQGTTEHLADLIDQHKLDIGKFYIEDISSNKLIVRYRD